MFLNVIAYQSTQAAAVPTMVVRTLFSKYARRGSETLGWVGVVARVLELGHLDVNYSTDNATSLLTTDHTAAAVLLYVCSAAIC